MNPLQQLGQSGQAVWLDFVRRGLFESGELERMVKEDGLRGVTSNPAIFEKAIAGSSDYAEALASLAGETALDAKAVYERLAVADIQHAADILLPVYRETRRRDGYVSLEVSPRLAHDTGGTLAEARRLWREVGRDNVMIKVPATDEGIPAIEELIAAGINVNVTLIFSLEAYQRVAEAHLRGLERRSASGFEVAGVASVASFFISRIDAAVDAQLEQRLAAVEKDEERQRIDSLLGRTAVANAKLAYQLYQDLSSGERWQRLAAAGAQTQRLLWASTSTKSPRYSDVYYIEELIGAETVNTIPPATYEAFRGHGRVRASLGEGRAEARRVLEGLDAQGISLAGVTERLLADGVRLFEEAFDRLLCAVTAARAGANGLGGRLGLSLPEALARQVETTAREWVAEGKVRRLWARDATLWTGGDEAEWLGWLTITDDQISHHEHLHAVADEARREGFESILLLGMGGSSLCPDVFRETFGRFDGFPVLHVLDSTDPDQIRAVEGRIDLARTLFVVSSKSGSTLEPNILKDYFLERVAGVLGGNKAGPRFIAITDPGSQLEVAARRDGFRHVFHGLPSIGGRYSALSDFGLVPAALMGIDLDRLLESTQLMVHACVPCVPAAENPGLRLGVVLGTLARAGHDKLTLVASPGIRALGAWLEQLVAESTGKEGRAIIPVDGETVAMPELYGDDRLFVYLRLESGPDERQDAAVARLEAAGHPVVRIAIADLYDIGQELFRWQLATAVAGSILEINPFDQPDVEASKVASRRLTDEYEARGVLPETDPIAVDGDLSLFADASYGDALSDRGSRSLGECLAAHLQEIEPSDYFAVLAYVHRSAQHDETLQAIRHAVRDGKRVATCLGYGPRFLHSTGQAYKGGPNSGVFLQITADGGDDLPVPGRRYSFAIVKTAQAQGDFQVLVERRRRALRVHLRGNVAAGLARLEELLDGAMATT